MYQKTLTMILAFATLFFLGYGITGFYSLDPTEHSLCVEDSDCAYAVCCPLAGKEYGLCGQESECADLYTSLDKTNLQNTPSIEIATERSYIAVALGIILLLILAIVGYLEWKEENTVKPKRRSKK